MSETTSSELNPQDIRNWNKFQGAARALCEGHCPLGASVASAGCGDGPAFTTIKTCTGVCQDRLNRALAGDFSDTEPPPENESDAEREVRLQREKNRRDRVLYFQNLHRVVGLAGIVTDCYHPKPQPESMPEPGQMAVEPELESR